VCLLRRCSVGTDSSKSSSPLLIEREKKLKGRKRFGHSIDNQDLSTCANELSTFQEKQLFKDFKSDTRNRLKGGTSVIKNINNRKEVEWQHGYLDQTARVMICHQE
jgi:hypothetical protein